MKDVLRQSETRQSKLLMFQLASAVFVSVVVGALLSGCAKENSDQQVVTISLTPTQYEYSQEFLDLAAEETGVLGDPCDRNIIDAECSALLRLVLDYGRVREQIREIER